MLEPKTGDVAEPMPEVRQIQAPSIGDGLRNQFHAVCVAHGSVLESGFDLTLEFTLTNPVSSHANPAQMTPTDLTPTSPIPNANALPIRLEFAGLASRLLRRTRPMDGFAGEYVARFFPRSSPDAGTQRVGTLTGLWQPSEEFIPVKPTWSVTGKVVRLDRADHLAVVRVFSRHKRQPPFTFAATANLDLLKSVEDAWYVNMTGTIEEDRFILESISEVKGLLVPEIWRDWKSPGREVLARQIVNQKVRPESSPTES